MHEEKILRLEFEIEGIKDYIKADKKEIKKREKILAITTDEEIEAEVGAYKEEIEKYTNLLKTKKELLRNYKKLWNN